MINQESGDKEAIAEKVKTFIAEAITQDGNTTKVGESGSIDLKNFKTYCKKCGSDEVVILTNFCYAQGSEYTGIYGQEVRLLFKCKSCGSAERIISSEMDSTDD